MEKSSFGFYYDCFKYLKKQIVYLVTIMFVTAAVNIFSAYIYMYLIDDINKIGAKNFLLLILVYFVFSNIENALTSYIAIYGKKHQIN